MLKLLNAWILNPEFQIRAKPYASEKRQLICFYETNTCHRLNIRTLTELGESYLRMKANRQQLIQEGYIQTRLCRCAGL